MWFGRSRSAFTFSNFISKFAGKLPLVLFADLPEKTNMRKKQPDLRDLLDLVRKVKNFDMTAGWCTVKAN